VISNLLVNEKKLNANIDYVFCSDSFLLRINKKFLNHNYLTDTITFNYSYDLKQLEGEVYISTDRIKKNAVRFSVAFDDEINRVMIHGALHLCGYDDKKKREAVVMKQKEDFYLNMFHVKQNDQKFHVKQQ
jgi:rRNA maturation RNase YbeY